MGQIGILIKMKKGIANLIIYNHLILLVPGAGIEPARHIVTRDFKSLASTYSATRAWCYPH